MGQIDEIVKQLEARRATIEKALVALYEVDGGEVSGGSAQATPVPVTANDRRSAAQKARWAAKRAAESAVSATRKGGMTPEGRKRLVKALKKRWAAKRAAAKGAPAEAPAKATTKRGISAAGRKALAEAMKRRWAVKRAAAKKAGRPKKAA